MKIRGGPGGPLLPLVMLALVALGLGFRLHAVVTREPLRLLTGEATKTASLPGPGAGELQGAFVAIADRVRPAVVNIGTVQTSPGRRPFGFEQPFPDDPFFRDFF